MQLFHVQIVQSISAEGFQGKLNICIDAPNWWPSRFLGLNPPDSS